MKHTALKFLAVFSILFFTQSSLVSAAVPTVTLKDPTAVASTFVTLNAAISGASASTVYGFEYGPTSDYRFATSDFANLNTKSFSKEIYGLKCNTEYHYRAYAENSSGKASTADSVFKTAECGALDPSTSDPSVGGSSGSNGGSGSTGTGIGTDIDLTDPVDQNPTNPQTGSNGSAGTTNDPTAVPLDYKSWVKCDGVITPGEKDRQNKCDFVALINTAKGLINWAFMLSIPLIIGIMAYAGFLYMTGSEGNIKKAKGFIWNAIIGFVIMLSAWFIVTFVLNQLLTNEFKSVTGTLIETQK